MILTQSLSGMSQSRHAVMGSATISGSGGGGGGSGSSGDVTAAFGAVEMVTLKEEGKALGTHWAPRETSPPEPGTVPEFDAGEIWAGFAAILVVAALGVVAAQLATGASLKAVGDAYLGGQPRWSASLRFAASRLRSLLWLGLITGVILLLSFLACIAPGVYLWGAWSVAVPALLLEDARGFQALNRSASLVRGRWWPSFAVVLLGYVLATVVNTIFSALLVGVTFATDGQNEVVIFAFQAVAGTVSGVLVAPFRAAVAAILYFDLRVRKEGLDLELLAQRIGTDTAESPRPALLPPPPQWPAPPPPTPGWQPPPWQTPPQDQPPPGWHAPPQDQQPSGWQHRPRRSRTTLPPADEPSDE